MGVGIGVGVGVGIGRGDLLVDKGDDLIKGAASLVGDTRAVGLDKDKSGETRDSERGINKVGGGVDLCDGDVGLCVLKVLSDLIPNGGQRLAVSTPRGLLLHFIQFQRFRTRFQIVESKKENEGERRKESFRTGLVQVVIDITRLTAKSSYSEEKEGRKERKRKERKGKERKKQT